MHKVIVAVLAVITCLSLVMIGCAQPAPPDPDKKITIGNKGFTEQYIIGQLMKQVLEKHGFKVDLLSDLSSEVLRGKMQDGDIDIAAEYTGTAWMVHLANVYDLGMDNNED